MSKLPDKRPAEPEQPDDDSVRALENFRAFAPDLYRQQNACLQAMDDAQPQPGDDHA